MNNIGAWLMGLIAALLLLSLSAFTVDEREYALVFRLGEIISVKKEPGLYFKVPMVDNVRYYDRRILTLNWVEPDRFLTSEKKNVLVDSFVKWRIIDPVKYFVSVSGDELQAERRLSQTINDGLRAEFGKRTVHDVISGERSQIMDILRQRADRDGDQGGAEADDDAVHEPAHEIVAGGGLRGPGRGPTLEIGRASVQQRPVILQGRAVGQQGRRIGENLVLRL